jgi:hypothetical protein
MKKYLPHVLAAAVLAAALGYAFVYEAGRAPVPAPEVPAAPEAPVPPPSEPPATPPPDAPAEPVEHNDLIRVTSPRPNQLVTSPIIVEGEARGNWYFEASFPVTLYDANGEVMVQHYAMTSSEWMTTDYVPFRTEIRYEDPPTATGTLVLSKDNPSGLPENDDQVSIDVRFAEYGAGEAEPPVASGCRPTGCSGQVCADEDVITTCEFRPEYACYRDATCERQADGRCGWTMTTELRSCLDASVNVE